MERIHHSTATAHAEDPEEAIVECVYERFPDVMTIHAALRTIATKLDSTCMNQPPTRRTVRSFNNSSSGLVDWTTGILSAFAWFIAISQIPFFRKKNARASRSSAGTLKNCSAFPSILRNHELSDGMALVPRTKRENPTGNEEANEAVMLVLVSS
jgi:hypothetical protein